MEGMDIVVWYGVVLFMWNIYRWRVLLLRAGDSKLKHCIVESHSISKKQDRFYQFPFAEGSSQTATKSGSSTYYILATWQVRVRKYHQWGEEEMCLCIKMKLYNHWLSQFHEIQANGFYNHLKDLSADFWQLVHWSMPHIFLIHPCTCP